MRYYISPVLPNSLRVNCFMFFPFLCKHTFGISRQYLNLVIHILLIRKLTSLYFYRATSLFQWKLRNWRNKHFAWQKISADVEIWTIDSKDVLVTRPDEKISFRWKMKLKQLLEITDKARNRIVLILVISMLNVCGVE